MNDVLKNGQRIKIETTSGIRCSGTVIGLVIQERSGPTTLGDIEYIVKLDERIEEWPFDAVTVSGDFITPIVTNEDIDFDKLAQDISDF